MIIIIQLLCGLLWEKENDDYDDYYVFVKTQGHNRVRHIESGRHVRENWFKMNHEL